MEWIKKILPYIGIIIAVVFIRSFIITPVRVDGSSMDPTLKDKDIIMLKKYDKKYQYGDIVILNYQNSKLVKRIIGLPKDKIKYANGQLFVNGKKVIDPYSDITKNFELEQEIPENYYFVMGDNRNNSTDSRVIGFIKKEEILGTASFRIFPLNHIGKIK